MEVPICYFQSREEVEILEEIRLPNRGQKKSLIGEDTDIFYFLVEWWLDDVLHEKKGN